MLSMSNWILKMTYVSRLLRLQMINSHWAAKCSRNQGLPIWVGKQNWRHDWSYKRASKTWGYATGMLNIPLKCFTVQYLNEYISSKYANISYSMLIILTIRLISNWHTTIARIYGYNKVSFHHWKVLYETSTFCYPKWKWKLLSWIYLLVLTNY